MVLQNCYANVYLIFYATHKGKTGHVGIAVSNYTIFIKEESNNETVIQKQDTVANAGLLYYDLWPNDDQFSVWNTGKNIDAIYYKLPFSADEEITLSSLYQSGIPHKEFYPCDGILSIPTTWEQNKKLERMLDNMVESRRQFNGRKYNCADFVKLALETIVDKKIKTKEFIGLGWSSTPNKLYRSISKQPNVKVIKEAGQKANGSFLIQRVLYKMFNRHKPIINQA